MFRNFATSRDVHVTVVVHPRKTQTSKNGGLAVINEYDLAGRARGIQEADNVIIMQTKLDRGEPREDWIQARIEKFIYIGKSIIRGRIK